MADVIKNFPSRLHKMTQVFYREVPSQVATRRFIDTLTNLLFPVRDKRNISLKEMDLKWENLQHDFLEIISPLCADMDCCCEHLTERFFGEIPLIYTRLMQDANLYKNCDPAAYCTEEVILCYPGFYAVMVYRLSHVLHKLKIPVLPRVISEYAHSQTGIDIHPGRTSTSTTAPGSSSAKRPLSGGTSKFTRASRWAPRLSTKSFRASGVIRPSRTT